MQNQINRLISINSFYQNYSNRTDYHARKTPPIYGYQSALQEIKTELFALG